MNETIRDLKSELKQRDKHIKFLEQEIENLVKPVRTRRQHVEQPKLTEAEWKVDFIRRFKKEVLGEKG